VAEFEIVVQGSPPPRPGRSHWGVIQRAKKQWTEYIGFVALNRRLPKQDAIGRRKVEIVFHRPGPVSDDDNAHALCKVPLDALVRCGLLRDDSPSCVQLVVGTVSSGKSFTVIRVSDLTTAV